MNWQVSYLPEVKKDLQGLAHNQQLAVFKAIRKVSENPLPQSEGGYGKPLGHKSGSNLTNLLKIKLRGEGIRVVYKLLRTETEMLIIVVGIREDDEVYDLAGKRKNRHGL